MKGKGPKRERETIINLNEEDETATVWTASGSVYNRLLKRLGRAYLTEDGERHAVFTFPAEFVQLPRPKAKRVLTLEQKAQLAGRLAGSPEIQGGKRQSRAIPEGAKDGQRQMRRMNNDRRVSLPSEEP